MWSVTCHGTKPQAIEIDTCGCLRDSISTSALSLLFILYILAQVPKPDKESDDPDLEDWVAAMSLMYE